MLVGAPVIMLVLTYGAAAHAGGLAANRAAAGDHVQESAGTLVNSFVDIVLDRAAIVSGPPRPHGALDTALQGKAGQLATSSLQHTGLGSRPMLVKGRAGEVLQPSIAQRHISASRQPWADHRQHFPGTNGGRHVHTAAFQGMMDKLGGLKDLKDEASKDPEAEKRILEGKMNFDDFIDSMSLMDKAQGMAGGVAGVLKNIPGMAGKMPSQEQIQESQKQLKIFKAIIAKMDEEERKAPELFFQESGKERILRVAEDCDQDPEMVRRFLAYFKTTSTMSMNIAKGQKPTDFKAQMEKDLEEVPAVSARYNIQMDKAEPANRMQRRAKKKQEKKAGSTGTGFR